MYSLGALALCINLLTAAVDSWAFRQNLERGNLPAAARATEVMARLGAASSARHIELANAYARSGDTKQARRQFRKSLRIQETTQGWHGLGLLAEKNRNWEAALGAYDRALLLKEDDVTALLRSGQVLMWMNEPQQAVERLERAAQGAPQQAAIATALRRAKRQAEAAEAP